MHGSLLHDLQHSVNLLWYAWYQVKYAWNESFNMH